MNIFQLMLPLNYIFFGLVFLAIFLARNDVRYTGWFALAYITTFVGALIEIFHAKLDFGALRFDDISNALYFIIAATTTIGIAKSEKVKPPYKFLGFTAVAGYIGQAYLAYIADDFFWRILFCDVIAAILFGPIFFIMRKAKKNIINRVLFWAFTLLIAVTLIRPAIGFFLLDPNISMATYESDPYLITFYFAGSILAIMLAIPMLGKITSDIMETYRQASLKDPLTGMLNRRGLKIAYEELQSSSGSKEHFIIQFDLDHFKKINDSFGHGVGDLVLLRTAKIVESIINNKGICARIGGEEFVILLSHQTQEMAILLAQNLRQSFAVQAYPEISNAMPTTASFGVAPVNIVDSLERAIKNADEALYMAKDTGRNCVRLLDDNSSAQTILQCA